MGKEVISASISPEAKEILDAGADLAQVSRSQFVEIAIVSAVKAICEQVKVEDELEKQAEERTTRIREAFGVGTEVTR
jgi:uncharacterized protein (DUF1778 family)